MSRSPTSANITLNVEVGHHVTSGEKSILDRSCNNTKCSRSGLEQRIIAWRHEIDHGPTQQEVLLYPSHYLAEQTTASFARGLAEREIEYQATHAKSVSSESESAIAEQQKNRRRCPLYTRPVRVLNNIPATAEERELDAQFKKLFMNTSEESGEDRMDKSSEDVERVPLEAKGYEITMKIMRVREK